MRRRHRRGNKQRKIIIGSMLCLLVLFTVGYSAFQTNLNVNVKGNVKKKTAGQELVEKVGVVDSGDGLYKDTVTEGRYYYRGSSPNNYITFNNETWRIISIESDGTLKIVRNEQLSGTYEWDSASNYRNGGAYCTAASGWGCNAWAATSNLVGSPSEFIQYSANGNTNDSTKYSGSVSKNSTMLTYLNETYYASLSNSAKAQILKGTFNVSTPGTTDDVESLETDARQEAQYQWKGFVAMNTITELLRASTDNSCISLSSGYNGANKGACYYSNWLWGASTYGAIMWTLSPYIEGKQTNIWIVDYGGCVYGDYAIFSHSVYPVLHLSSDITLSGDGTSSSLYAIN